MVIKFYSHVLKFLVVLFFNVIVAQIAFTQLRVPPYQQDDYRCFLSYEDYDLHWYDTTTVLTPIDSTVLQYNQHNQLIKETIWSWEGEEERYSYRMAHDSMVYNIFGQITDSFYYYTAIAFTYNNCLQIEKRAYYDFSSNEPIQDREYYYDPQGRITNIEWWEYYGDDRMLRNEYRYFYLDDHLDRVDYYYHQCGSNCPIQVTRTFHYYNADGECIADTVFFKPGLDEPWTNLKLASHTYENGKKASTYYKYFNNDLSQWLTYARSLWEYDDLGRPTIDSYESYSGGIFNSGDRSVYLYDSIGNLVTERRESQMIGGTEWLLQVIFSYYYEKKTIEQPAEKFSLSFAPNPVSCAFIACVESPIETSGNIYVITANGAVILENEIEIHAGQNNFFLGPPTCINGFLSPGIYFVKISSPEFQASGKFVSVRTH